ncbi:MliC family protein [Vibrio panuliri]|uniref:C-type lysozyme inhibitor domain-containing protein n=1 Tax=Vibrio panuliri TaxID=1381081 RepID=A0ABX3FT18_9VIBR|nr:MliC family protein [Vibrio panuliri]KAB1453664.1 lysozyme inhibitor [Vibrio panuliri]OLQ96142.1 hypothetical protein BIY20_05100 [Vibrio panuliri]
MFRASILMTSAVLLAGCATSDDSSTNTNDQYGYQYLCSGDKEFFADFLVEEQGALVKVEDVDYALVQVPSGSGTRYMLPENAQSEIQPVNLYTKGNYARLELGREIYKNCESQ